MQDPTVFDKANMTAITNEKVWDTGDIKSGALDIYLKVKAPACNFFQNNDQSMLLNLTDCPDRLTRFSVQYRPGKKCKI